MKNALIRKLQSVLELTDDERTALMVLSLNARHVGSRQDLIHEGERPRTVDLILEGFACRYKLLSGGKRQITDFLLPGDMTDLDICIIGKMDHAVATISPCSVVEMPLSAIEDLTAHHPRVVKAMRRMALVEKAILRERIAGMGQRSADRQLAHLLCELLVRLQTVGYAGKNDYRLPLRQQDLGDTLGISLVHANRMLQQLRDQGLISLDGRRLVIHDVKALMERGEFKPDYLHLT
ncbi:Crp/Fnr family transcriptional regulator [Jiella sp. M17.18]|uniref:Crp/Fnr family transcriptional regulator n=1 Tax=Jiella sp. M17.18 TaxID=3234247 RepID=UPI0034DF7B75